MPQFKRHNSVGLVLSTVLFSYLPQAIAGAMGPVATPGPKQVEFSVGVGPTWLNANNPVMDVTTTDPNLEVVSGVNTDALYTAGIGYPILVDELAGRTYFNSLMLELNYYYTQTTIKGDAWDYSSPSAANQSFKAAFKSSRIMLDFKPGLVQYRGIASYLILGVGPAWNKLSYQEQANAPEFAISSIQLPVHTNSNVAYNLGVGLNKKFGDHFKVSMEYLYTPLGHVAASRYSQSAQSIISAASFALDSNNLLFKFTYAV
ncbi:outer membrane beta-barrel protein [Legionella sp. km772]|uniref:outer membrane beta-barrel protein n=1 Tax=Legionella sp. km772 TaxID=2498111 RepID=UPI000F8E0B87|nr:outer membrane beta-barrel protein [Legionella sp. km772]RUR07431.1 hypothetical protein ELY15_12215 [Legionella sp. km772]